MRRFFRSAAFPILIVVVLAFFAQRLISPSESQEPPSYSEFVRQVESGQIDEVTFNTKDNSLNVKPKSGEEYDTGFLDSDAAQAQLLNELRRNGVQTQVKDKGGGGILSLLTYILPFLLF